MLEDVKRGRADEVADRFLRRGGEGGRGGRERRVLRSLAEEAQRKGGGTYVFVVVGADGYKLVQRHGVWRIGEYGRRRER